MRAVSQSQARRGSLIIASLLLFSILLALGLGLMSSQSARMRVAESQVKSIQAKALCEAAWEDARVKLGKDILFPLPVEGQNFFAYSEDVYIDVNGSEQLLGSYTVVIDFTLSRNLRQSTNLEDDTEVRIPDGIFQITCIGKIGRRDSVPDAERVMVYELVMSAPPSPDAHNGIFQVIRVEDQGSI